MNIHASNIVACVCVQKMLEMKQDLRSKQQLSLIQTSWYNVWSFLYSLLPIHSHQLIFTWTKAPSAHLCTSTQQLLDNSFSCIREESDMQSQAPHLLLFTVPIVPCTSRDVGLVSHCRAISTRRCLTANVGKEQKHLPVVPNSLLTAEVYQQCKPFSCLMEEMWLLLKISWLILLLYLVPSISFRDSFLP